MALGILLWCVAALLVLAVLGIALARRPFGSGAIYGACLVVSAVGCATATGSLLAPAALAPETVLPVGLPWSGAHFRLDGLSAFFSALVNLGAAAASLFALGYGRHETAPGRVLPFYPAFLAGMNLVVLADDAFVFLLCWELMSLSSWALVVAHHKVRENVEAGFLYLVMASFGTLALLLAFGVLAGPDGGYDFASIRAAAPGPLQSGLVLALVLVGAGSKAGLVPLHVWLPLAHPAAPSHVSALMSGVMTKVALYGFIRIVFDLLGPPQWWWAVAVIVPGGLTAVLGILYALLQRDLKRLLAYSTVENIGIVFAGLGLALAFRASGMELAAALALTAALFHALNHTLFKSLLFFGAGAVLNATGERDMERLGGLIHRMPATAALVLVGCVAISALPPLNGFASEWLLFQAILLSPELSQWGLRIIVPAVGALLALAAALAAACFVRAYGTAFLGRPRGEAASDAHEVDRLSLAAMGLLALLCLAAGILPGYVIDALGGAVGPLVGAVMPHQGAARWFTIVPVAESRSSYDGLLVFLFVASSAGLAALAIHRFGSRRMRRAPAWDCGFPDPSVSTQYTAGSVAQPIRRVFGTLLFRARESVDMPAPGEMRPARFDLVVRDLAWEWLYAPLSGAVALVAGRLNHLQFLTIRRYLSLVFVALVGLLTVLALWQ